MKIPQQKLFLIKKLRPRAIAYLLVYLVLGFIYALNTTIDTNWNVRILGIIKYLFPSLKGIFYIVFFVLVKVIIYFLLVLFLEYWFAKVSEVNISSKEFSQTVVDKKLSLNGKNYQIDETVLTKKAWGKQKVKKISGKMLVCEEDFEVNFSSQIVLKELIQLKKEKYVKEITWWKANRSKFLFSLILVLVIGCLLFIGICFKLISPLFF